MASTNTDLKPESAYPGGDLTARTMEAIAEEVAYLRSHGLPIVVDRGNGVEVLRYPVEIDQDVATSAQLDGSEPSRG